MTILLALIVVLLFMILLAQFKAGRILMAVVVLAFLASYFWLAGG